MKKIWIERAEVERFIMHKDEDMQVGVDFDVGEAEYAELLVLMKQSHRLQKRLEELYEGGGE